MTETKHGLKTSVGIKEKKIEDLEAKLAEYESIKPKSPEGEALKEAVRAFLSLLVGMTVTYYYQKYPILGQLQSDQAVVVTVLVGLLTRSVEKWWYQFKKNRGDVGQGVGFDLLFVTLGNLWGRRKSLLNPRA